MPSELTRLLDGEALLIVVAGTLLASLARCGFRNLFGAVHAGFTLIHKHFDEASNRAAIARIVRSIEHSGPLAVESPLPPDPELAQLLESYLRSGSPSAMFSMRAAQQKSSEARMSEAANVLVVAAELAPMFGLVGTLYSITNLAPAGAVNTLETTMSAIATAVTSTLYGVLLAHLVCLPIAAMIERRAKLEARLRDALLEWFASQLTSPVVTAAQQPKIRGVA